MIKSIIKLLDFRVGMVVTEYVSYWEASLACYFDYDICPRCGVSMDRGRQSYCDRCGQRLKRSSKMKQKATKK